MATILQSASAGLRLQPAYRLDSTKKERCHASSILGDLVSEIGSGEICPRSTATFAWTAVVGTVDGEKLL